MSKFLWIFLCLFMVEPGIGFSQCPDWGIIEKRVNALTEQPPTAALLHDVITELTGYEQAVQRCPQKNDSLEAVLLYRIALLQYDKDDLVAAITHLLKAIHLQEISGALPIDRIKNYYALATFYNELKQTANRIPALDSCITIGLTANIVNDYLLNAINEKIKYSYNSGDYLKAYENAILGETIMQQIPGSIVEEGPTYKAAFFAWSVNALIKLKSFDKAIYLLEGKIQSGSSNPAALGTYYEQLAQAAFEKGNIALADASFRRAYRADSLARNYLGCAQTLNNIGYYIYNIHYRNYDSAIHYYNQSLLKFKKSGKPDVALQFEQLNTYGNIATAYLGKNDFNNAFVHFKIALDQLKPGISETDLFQTRWLSSSNVRYLSALLIKKSEAYVQKFKKDNRVANIEEAIRLCRVTDQLLDKIKEGQFEQESKLLWRQDTRNLYEHAIEACLLARRPHEAFNFFEKSRAVLLSDQLENMQHISPADLLTMAQLKRNIVHLTRQSESELLKPGKSGTLNAQIFHAKQELARLEAGLKMKTKPYQQQMLDTTTLSVASLQEQLQQGKQSLLEVFWGDQAAYILFITPDSVFLKKTDIALFTSLATAHMQIIADPAKLNMQFGAFSRCAGDLYKLIFEGLPSPTKRLVISTDGIHFPFESLIIAMNENSPRYLLQEYAVSYTYSARFFMNEFAVSGASNENIFMGMAPVQFPAAWTLNALYGSDISLKKITGYFSNASSNIATQASRWNFLQNFSRYSIIQLYTHATSKSRYDEPVIYFADSALYLSDLISENKPATRLIVLSACETGNGKEYAGEGVFSFNRAFAAMGVPSAIASLWSVDNTATYQITELFYKYLSQDLPTDLALQKAKVAFLKNASRQYSLPYYWAGPVLIGKPEKIPFNNPPGLQWLVISGIAAIGALIVIVYRHHGISQLTALKKRKKVRDRQVGDVK